MLSLTRRQSLQTSTVQGLVVFNHVEGMKKRTKIDTYLYVWASPKEVMSITS